MHPMHHLISLHKRLTIDKNRMGSTSSKGGKFIYHFHSMDTPHRILHKYGYTHESSKNNINTYVHPSGHKVHVKHDYSNHYPKSVVSYRMPHNMVL